MHMKKMMYVISQIKMPKKLCEEHYVAKKERKSFKQDLPIKSNQKLDIVH